ncbi:MAG TPA: hypothetical protein DCZ92_11975 [Elusimicrobia bacterium]|nr:MAG: hypothetical protein A2016_01520 [Elusimicrobia bacterium GWF2_62_30]HBA61508.1 hypothetical protein [Elusimicrobiota bacterium]
MNGPAEAFNSDLDYLWEAMRHAQDISARAELARTAAATGLERTAQRVSDLERQLERGAARERELAKEIAALNSALEKDQALLSEAARQAAAGKLQAEKSAAAQKELAGAGTREALLQARISGLGAESEALRAALKSRESEVEALKNNLAGLAALPELARLLKEESQASGKPRNLYDELVANLEEQKRRTADAAARLQKASAQAALLGEKMAAVERENSALRGTIAARLAEITRLEGALSRSLSEAGISSGEHTALAARTAELAAGLGKSEGALEQASARENTLRRQLQDAAAEAERLRRAADEQALRADEHKSNFAGAVAQVFELQNKAAALRAALEAEKEKNAELSAALEATQAGLEKVNTLLLGAKTGLASEKEASRRALAKIKTLEAAIEELKTKMAASEDYSGKLLHAIEERDRRILQLKTDLKQVDVLKAEKDDLLHKNLRFTGLIRHEQADFNTRMIASLEKTAAGVKMFNSRVAPEHRKGLEPALKNLLGAVDLLKGWKEYLDDDVPEFRETELGPFCLGEVRKWERQFKQRGISLSSACASAKLGAAIDPARIKLLIHNLVKNAYDHLAYGGSLRVLLKASDDGAQAVLTFEDTGPGLPLETLQKLFMPFNTTEKARSGIGLAVAHRIAQKHGGTLAVSNRKERGALAEVRLPLSAPAK